MKIKATKHIALFLCLTMLATLIFSAPISAETGSAIVKILSGTELALGETLKVNAQIPSLTTKAELYLDNALIDEVTEAEDDGIYILSGIVPQTAIGTKTLKLVVDGETAYTDTIEVYKKIIQGNKSWQQDFTGFKEDDASAVSNLNAGNYSSNLTINTDGTLISGNLINNEEATDTGVISMVPNSNCKYYVGSLGGNTAMVGQYTKISTSSRPYINVFSQNVGGGLYEFSFNIASVSDMRVFFSPIKSYNKTTITLTSDYDIINDDTAARFYIEDTMIAVGETFKSFVYNNIKLVIDMNNGNYKILMNDIIAETGTVAHDFNSDPLNNFKLEVNGANAGSQPWKDALAAGNPLFYIDDISSMNYTVVRAPKAESLSCDGETLVLSDAVIPVGANSVTAVMDTELASATAYIEDATGTKVADATIDGENVSADTSAIKTDGQYYLVVNSTVEGAQAKTVIPFKAYYACDDGLMVGTSVKLEGNNVVASFDAVNGGAEKDVKFILCTYDDKALLDLTILPLTVTAGNKANETISLSKSTADSAKVMLWYDSQTDINPVIASEAITIGAQQ